MSAQVDLSTFHFLAALEKHNSRAWFENHRQEYHAAKANVELFADDLIRRMSRHDRLSTVTGRQALYRIYNDVRFSKDKAPYKPRFAGRLVRVKPMLRGGYYFWLKPGASRIGCGFTYPSPADLKRIRQDIDHNYPDWYKLLKRKSIVQAFGVMTGDRLRTVPQGYPRDHPAIELLRYRQFWFEHAFTDREVLAPAFAETATTTYRAIRPFFDYMSEVLTTDANGEPIV